MNLLKFLIDEYHKLMLIILFCTKTIPKTQNEGKCDVKTKIIGCTHILYIFLSLYKINFQTYA